LTPKFAGVDCPDGGPAAVPSKLAAPSAAEANPPAEGFQNGVLLVNCRASLMLPADDWFIVCSCWYCCRKPGEVLAAADGSVRLLSSEEVRKPPEDEVGDESSSSPRLDRNWWLGSWASCSIKLLL